LVFLIVIVYTGGGNFIPPERERGKGMSRLHTIARTKAKWSLVVTIACLCLTVRADDKAPPRVDPKADELLQRMGKTVGNASSFTFEANDMSDEMLPSGQKIQYSKTVSITVRRPDSIRADISGDLKDQQFIYSGSKLVIYNRRDNVFTKADVPTNIDAMFDFLETHFGITAPLSDLMFADPYQSLTEHVESGVDLGIHEVNGVKCHHLAFRQEGIDWQIWLEDTDQALPRKIVITYKDLAGEPQYVAFLDKWNLSAQIPDSTFTFTPPDGATQRDLAPADEADKLPVKR
jgi:hypothetical protein